MINNQLPPNLLSMYLFDINLILRASDSAGWEALFVVYIYK